MGKTGSFFWKSREEHVNSCDGQVFPIFFFLIIIWFLEFNVFPTFLLLRSSASKAEDKRKCE